jgi:hypothetical protein
MAPNTKDPIQCKYPIIYLNIKKKSIFYLLARAISSVNRDELSSVFDRYAHHEHLGERYMTPHEFLQDYLGYLKGDNIDPKTLDILSALVDLNKDQSLFEF